MYSQQQSSDDPYDKIRILVEAERFSSLSEEIGKLPTDSKSSRDVEELFSDLSIKLRTSFPAALISSLKKLNELEDPGRLSYSIAYQLFMNYHGRDHRICELAVDLMSKFDPLLKSQHPYIIYDNALSELDRLNRDRSWYFLLLRDIKETFGQQYSSPRCELPELLDSTYKFYRHRIHQVISSAPQDELDQLTENRGTIIAGYMNIAFEFGFVHGTLDSFRTHLIFNQTFQKIADTIDSIFLNSFPITFSISREAAQKLIDEVSSDESSNQDGGDSTSEE